MAVRHLNEILPDLPEPLATRSLSKVTMRSIEWLDKPLFQGSAFHLLVGKKGVGKGTYLAHLAAKVTDGRLFGVPRGVLMVSSEDSPEIDLKPRVVAAGGDCEMISTVTSPFSLPRDLARFRLTITSMTGIGMVVIDPIGNHLAGKDTDSESTVRDAIGPLNELAHELGILLIGVRHLGKDVSKGALSSILGSTAWRDVPRAVLGVAADDEEDMTYHLQVLAGNRSARGRGRQFRIEMADVEGLTEQVTRAVEMGESSKDVENLLADSDDGRSRREAPKRDGCAEIILRELAKGPQTMSYLNAVCIEEIDAAGNTAWRAANGLKAQGKARPSNNGPGTPWYWTLTGKTDDEV